MEWAAETTLNWNETFKGIVCVIQPSTEQECRESGGELEWLVIDGLFKASNINLMEETNIDCEYSSTIWLSINYVQSNVQT